MLQAILSQVLLPDGKGNGRAMACEVLMVTSAIRNLIREQKIEQIMIVLQTGGKFGMQTMNQSLAKLFQRRLISMETAMSRSSDADELRSLMGQAGASARPPAHRAIGGKR